LAEIGENDRVKYFGEPVGFDPYIGPCPLVVKDAYGFFNTKIVDATLAGAV
jgi:hypothetical protein